MSLEDSDVQSLKFRVDYIDKNEPHFKLSVGASYNNNYHTFRKVSSQKDFVEIALNMIDCIYSFSRRKSYEISFSDKAGEVLGERKKELLEKIVGLKGF